MEAMKSKLKARKTPNHYSCPSYITLSSKGEFFAATSCVCQDIWLKIILKELCFKQPEPTPIYFDSNSTIKLSNNLVLHGRSKHIDVKYHFLWGLTKDGMIDLIYYKSEVQVTDMCTKSLKSLTFQKLRKLLVVCTLDNRIYVRVLRGLLLLNWLLWQKTLV